ncbi:MULTISPECIES: 2-dehydropantoate 2-reductase [unclassified Cupriavidus]|uniref:2-dehydropantoate 2-reductase n=1 Tax=unclassified Cupriavidus TaxID=2640874 RepID=UPI0008804B97|nr:2-dehydropantoate 2-reductase [Cupriavidus sp. YR651]SDC64442.1 2-dehydropantoate 2-reductase [Cupriavidus sp. YR651]
MRILALGAGAIGGYYGGRLVQQGADVTFLVRPARRTILERDGLNIRSQYGDYHAAVRTVTQEELDGHWDIVLLTSKAYDLASAIEAIRPAVGPNSAVLPLLNGMAHLDKLNKAFGAERVLGGLAKIIVTLDKEGTIQHLNDWCYIKFGEQSGVMSDRVQALQRAFPKDSVVATAVPDIMHHLWEKFVHLATVATVTTLLRASVGDIARVPGGTELFYQVLSVHAEVAAREGYPMTDAFLAEYRQLFANKDSAYVPSILRDLEKKSAIEGDHIVGYMLSRIRAHGLDESVHRICLLNLQAYEVRRAAGRL